MGRPTATLDAPATSSTPSGDLVDTARTLSILSRLLAGYGRRDFSIRLWDGTIVPPDPGVEAEFSLVLQRPGALRRMLLPPNELALGEAYLEGDFDLEGDIIAAMRLSDAFEKLSMKPGDMMSLARDAMALPATDAPGAGSRDQVTVAGRQHAQLSGEEHSRERDRKAVSYHYDTGNDFFELFLDRRMIYSCGYFPTGQEDLDTAQEMKLGYICRKLRLRPGERLLDIGCGWGGLIMHAAERFGVHAMGITLSRSQAELATEKIADAGLSDRCRVMLLDYRDLASVGPFDKIVSVGMVEHVGKAKLLEYFHSAWKGLKPGGVFLNHGITAAAHDAASYNLLDRYLFQKGTFIRKYIFPDAETLPLSETLAAAERAGFEVRDVESLREHYALTLRHWVSRLERNREAASRMVGERTYRVWKLYMAGCAHAFATARLSVHQSLLSKPDGKGRSGLPWNRVDLYG